MLRLGAMVMGLPRRRVEEMLEVVGLSGSEGDRRVGNYSLGMRQRLGIAHALLGDPQVLILDEPANGLDPAGIHWMRGLLKGFAERGGTVLLSSHLLHEIEVIADHLVVIGRGVIVADGSKADLLTGGRHAGPRAWSPRRWPAASTRPAAPTSPRRTARTSWRPPPSRSPRPPRAAASSSPSCAAPTAPGSRTCSCNSPPTTHERRSPHEHHDPRTRRIRPAVAPDPSVTAVPFSRLLRVELRKLVDTRAGFWLLAAIGIITCCRRRGSCSPRTPTS